MIWSLQDLFSNEQAITASAASSNVIDLGAPDTVLNGPYPLNRDIGRGTRVPFLIQVTEAFATLTSLTPSLQVSDSEAFSVYRTVWTGQAVPLAQLVAGYQFELLGLPQKVDLRYARLYFTVGGSNATAGKVTAGIPGEVQSPSVAGGAA